MENTPVADQVDIPKKNILFKVTTVSKVLAAILFITLPFIGGWIGYMYGNNNSINEITPNVESNTPNQIIVPDLNTETSTPIETNKMNWVTTKTSANGEEITIQYPTEIPVNVTALEENKPFALGIDPGYPNYILPLVTTKDILVAELTTDLRYLFYLKQDADSDTVTLYKGTMSSKIIEKITDYNLSVVKEILDYQLPIFMPLVASEDFIIYNTQLSTTSNQFIGKITTAENNTPLYVAPCAFDRHGDNVDFSPDKLHIVWNCHNDGTYVSDWNSTKKVLDFSDTMDPVAVSFMDNERIKFGNATEGRDILRAPYHSIKIDGTDTQLEEGSVYLGF